MAGCEMPGCQLSVSHTHSEGTVAVDPVYGEQIAAQPRQSCFYCRRGMHDSCVSGETSCPCCAHSAVATRCGSCAEHYLGYECPEHVAEPQCPFGPSNA